MSTIRVAIVGVGNCATLLIEGVTHYRDAGYLEAYMESFPENERARRRGIR